MNSSDQQQQQNRRDNTLLAQHGQLAPKPTGYGRLIVDVFIDPLMGWLRAGEIVAVHDGYISLNGGRWVARSLCYYGLRVPATELVEPYTPPVRVSVPRYAGMLGEVEMVK